MTIRCPYCDRPISLRDRICPHDGCQKPLDVLSLLKTSFARGKAVAGGDVIVRCPVCNTTQPLKAGRCSTCQTSFTIGAALAPILRGPRRFWDRHVVNAGRATKLAVQLGYVLVSAVLLWLTLAYVENHNPAVVYRSAIIAVGYLVLCILLLVWLVPRPKLLAFSRGVSRIIKLGFVANFFMLFLWLCLAIDTWKQRASTIVVIGVIAWGGFFLFINYVWPMWEAIGQYFNQTNGPAPFDPTAYQGRRAVRDQGGRRQT